MNGEVLVTLTEARIRLHELVRALDDERVILLRHGRPVGLMVGTDHYQALVARIEDLEDRLSIYEAQAEGSDMAVPWEKVKAEAGLVTSE